jgi:hypothetical protein
MCRTTAAFPCASLPATGIDYDRERQNLLSIAVGAVETDGVCVENKGVFLVERMISVPR